jgi:hypothetical protein
MKKINKERRKADLLALVKAIKSGYSGVLPTGEVVDRRKRPEAMPVPRNTLLGAPTPKKVR